MSRIRETFAELREKRLAIREKSRLTRESFLQNYERTLLTREINQKYRERYDALRDSSIYFHKHYW